MPRPQRCRRVCCEPEYERFSPDGIPVNEEVMLSVDEYESIRLMDLEGKTHEQAAAQMEISRTTVTEIYESARRKMADCVVNGKHLVISGGNYRLCSGGGQPTEQIILARKGNHSMRIAVTYDNGEIFQHFGHTENFKIYEVQDGKVTESRVVSTNGSGHGALAGMLKALETDVLICGGIGGGAQNALREAGIKLFGGVHGDADKAVEDFLADSLNYDPAAKCDHHDHNHGHEHGHTCGDHGCGNHGCH